MLFPTGSPYYKTSDRPTVEDVTNSSVVVSWPKAKNIPTGLEIHYYYIVWLQTGEGTFINVSRVPQVTDLDRLQSRITGLTFNTNYSVKLEPYRKYNERRQSGTSIGVTRFKTSCKGIFNSILCTFFLISRHYRAEKSQS